MLLANLNAAAFLLGSKTSVSINIKLKFFKLDNFTQSSTCQQCEFVLIDILLREVFLIIDKPL